MADYINDVKADVIQTRLLIGGSSAPHEHQYTPLDGDVAICMYGDNTMEHDENIFAYKKILENIDQNPTDLPSNVSRRVFIDDRAPNIKYYNGKPDLTGQLVIGKNLNSDHPTWCPIATLDDIPIVTTHTIVQIPNYDYIYHYGHDYYNEPTYTYSSSVAPDTSRVVGPIKRYTSDTYLPPAAAGKVKTIDGGASSCGGVTYIYNEKGDWYPNAQPADWGIEWVEEVTW